MNSLYGLHEALVMLSEEGLENSWKRHKENHLQLREGLEKLNIKFLVKEELIYQDFTELLWMPLYHYVLIFEGVNLLADNPEDSLKASNNQPILIFNGMNNDRVPSHHTDDLIESANSIGIEIEVNRYEELGHTRVLYDYPEEFAEKLIQFFTKNLSQ